ncbi:ATP-dependent zinc protease [Alkalilimnicola sp. S0819]|uniref:ATP-dependent zinc protease family protein n=1 Tax=Alkalilimnicola sp. S0819 TaxID=2613922 RepID=UPI00126297B3|nr:ATP-dependent zinc protease [Alkalilimnicola sp. S0819]KAB7622808.1 ATP-dependent zinc protease [Alkalilimnicola sp. S0819]MPQ17305.1 hypothetical protein [Alkalilimnicola sp. S0819]
MRRELARILLCLLFAAPVQAGGDTPSQRVVLGWVEYLHVGSTGWRIKAKLDSGANTASMHAENIERFERDGAPWVRFTVDLENHGKEKRQVFERPLARDVLIKNHAGPSDRRPVVEMDFCLGGETHTAEFSLVDRSRFIYPVLLGRRFLADVALIDPGNEFVGPGGCEQGAG